jgi:PAS domain S-box-containing protein
MRRFGLRVRRFLFGTFPLAAGLAWLWLFTQSGWCADFSDGPHPAANLLRVVIPSLLAFGLAVFVIVYRRMCEAEMAQTALRSVFDSVPDGIAIVNRHGRIVLANSQVERLLGYDSPELARVPVPDLLPGFPPEALTPPSAASLPEVTQLDLLARHKDGSDIPVEVRLGPRQTADGYFVTSVIRDLRARKRSEEALHRRDRALEAISQGIFITDCAQAGNPIVYVNPAFARITARPAEELVGKTWDAILGWGTNPTTLAGVETAIREERPFVAELYTRRQDGSCFWNVLSLAPIRDTAGKVSHFVGVVTDVSDLKRLEAQLRQAQKLEAIGRLAGGVAHDFNNVLTVILGHTEMLLQRLPPDQPAHRSIKEIHKAGDRAALLTRQLLAFSRKQVLAPVVVNLNTLIADMDQMLRRLIREDIHLTTTLEPDLRPVKVDAGQMGQVLMNLVVNARDAIPDGGKIVIETANLELTERGSRDCPEIPPGMYVMLAVSDTGCGIDDATKSHIFEPFFTTKEMGQGTGLGLATVYGVIKQSGGYIYVNSKPGQGSTFTIFLPCAQEEAAVVRKPVAKPASHHGETVLLVEDEAGVRFIASQVLQEHGYTVLEARHGIEALQLSERHPGTIHLMVTDVVMPQMSGGELASRLATRRPGMKVLYMSGYTDDAIVRHGVSSADAIFLQKPFTAESLAAKVREVLGPATKRLDKRPSRPASREINLQSA